MYTTSWLNKSINISFNTSHTDWRNPTPYRYGKPGPDPHYHHPYGKPWHIYHYRDKHGPALCHCNGDPPPRCGSIHTGGHEKGNSDIPCTVTLTGRLFSLPEAQDLGITIWNYITPGLRSNHRLHGSGHLCTYGVILVQTYDGHCNWLGYPCFGVHTGDDGVHSQGNGAVCTGQVYHYPSSQWYSAQLWSIPESIPHCGHPKIIITYVTHPQTLFKTQNGDTLCQWNHVKGCDLLHAALTHRI